MTTLSLKQYHVARSRGGELFVVTKVTEDVDFPVKAKKVISRKAKEPTDTHNVYTFTKEGRYNLSDYDSNNDLLESRPLKDGESFKFADNLQEVLFVQCHDLVGMFEVMDVSKTVKPDWVK